MGISKDDKMDDRIRDNARELADTLNDMIENMSREYWKMHEEISTAEFTSRWEQMAALKKLGQYAVALEAVGNAYSAVNTCRCI